ncbi:hypothetical protein RU97_GL002316 [Enterococcus canis]|uniref:Uncharacterized protein n=1 Tax=Enterococcus canis TaxID=214095 RepID=A0A1L8RET7_9ENTE|nr:hypothetical protein RU97_GL002316 [Enterococcus canis]
MKSIFQNNYLKNKNSEDRILQVPRNYVILTNEIRKQQSKCFFHSFLGVD